MRLLAILASALIEQPSLAGKRRSRLLRLTASPWRRGVRTTSCRGRASYANWKARPFPLIAEILVTVYTRPNSGRRVAADAVSMLVSKPKALLQQTLDVSLNRTLFETLRERAAQDGTAMDTLVERALNEYFGLADRCGERTRATLKRLAASTD